VPTSVVYHDDGGVRRTTAALRGVANLFQEISNRMSSTHPGVPMNWSMQFAGTAHFSRT